MCKDLWVMQLLEIKAFVTNTEMPFAYLCNNQHNWHHNTIIILKYKASEGTFNETHSLRQMIYQ